MSDAVPPVARDQEIGQPINSEECSEAADGLHAKAKAEPGLHFYALYDKTSREDILAHAYAQCCSNKGAPGESWPRRMPRGSKSRTALRPQVG